MHTSTTPTAAHPALPPLATRLAGVQTSAIRNLLALTERPGIISFAGGLPAQELFDLEGLRTAMDAALSTGGAALQYSPTEGNRDLRRWIADRYTAAGAPTRAEDVLVTTGSQQALTLLATALVSPGDVVLVERPSYLAALQTFALAGARIVEVPGDTSGFDLDALDALARQHAPVLLYTIPTFQNPTGRTLPTEHRLRLVEIAARHGFRIVEDDPYRDLRYTGEACPSLASLDRHGTVVTTGSFSKVLAPGLRLGWIRTTPSIRTAVLVAKQASDLHTSTLDQSAAAHYLGTPAFETTLDRNRAAYTLRRDAMLTALPRVLPPGSTWTTPDGGMFLWVTLPHGHDTTALLPAAIDARVAYVPGTPFYATDPDPATMRLCFTTNTTEDTTQGLERLRDALTARASEPQTNRPTRQ